jgi:hypothetical protein
LLSSPVSPRKMPFAVAPMSTFPEIPLNLTLVGVAHPDVVLHR